MRQVGGRIADLFVTYAIEELVLSQEDAPAPEIHRTTCHFGHKSDIMVSRVGNLLFFNTSF